MIEMGMKWTFLGIVVATLGSLGQVAAQQDEDSSRQEQLSEAQAIVTRGERLSAQVGAMKTQAEREKDIIRVNCLNTKLAEVNANLRNAKARLDALRNEIDPQRRIQAVTVMIVLGQKFDVLDQEAGQCIGQNVFETGATKVDSSVDTTVVPNEQEAATATVPQVVPPAEVGQVQVLAPPTLEETSPDGDEV